MLFAFGPMGRRLFRKADVLFLALLFVGGAILWSLFYRTSIAHASFYSSVDWAVQTQYWSVLQEAFREGRIPYHVSEAIQPMQPTHRFLAIPETLSPLSPQAALLAFVSIHRFVILNTLLMYVLGFVGCAMLARRYCLSPYAFFMLWALFNFNGHVVSHMAAGHMWYGYFLLPFFVYWTLEPIRDGFDPKQPLLLALVMAAISLEGSLHLFVMCMMLLGLMSVFSRKARRTAILAVLVAVPLTAFRWAPASITFHDPTLGDYVPGYRSMHDFLLTVVSRDIYPRTIFPWEYDLYLSWTGLAFVAIVGLCGYFGRHPAWARAKFRGVNLPLAIMAILAFGQSTYVRLLALLPGNSPSPERVPTRFLVLPLLFWLTIACIRISRRGWWLARWPILGIPLLLSGPAMMVRLGEHWRRWSLDKVEHRFRNLLGTMHIPHIVAMKDPLYLHVLNVSHAVSLATLVVALALLYRFKRKKDAEVLNGYGHMLHGHSRVVT